MEQWIANGAKLAWLIDPIEGSYNFAGPFAIGAVASLVSTADGTITGVGSVATVAANSGASNGNNQPSATVNVTVALSHASPAGAMIRCRCPVTSSRPAAGEGGDGSSR